MKLMPHQSCSPSASEAIIFCTFPFKELEKWIKMQKTIFGKRLKDSRPTNVYVIIYFAKIRGKRPQSKVDTNYTSPVVWPSPYPCAQPYHLGRNQATMDSCFDLVKPHQHDIAGT